MLTEFLGRLMGVENLQSINSMRLSLAAPWAQNGPAWVLFGCAALAALAVVFYSRWQPSGHPRMCGLLAVSRAVLLVLMLLMLADPVLKMDFTSRPRPVLWVLFDGTESMDIHDEMTERERAKLAEAVGMNPQTGTAEQPSPGSTLSAPAANLSRMDYVKAVINRPGEENLLGRLEKNFRIETYILDRPDSVRRLNPAEAPRETIDPAFLSKQLTTKGQLTAIGTAFDDLAERHSTSNLAGLVMFSDFGNNNGPAPAGTADSPVKRLGVPVYAVGIGPQTAIDLATELELPRQLKKAERQEVKVILRQSGLDGRRAKVSVVARRNLR